MRPTLLLSLLFSSTLFASPATAAHSRRDGSKHRLSQLDARHGVLEVDLATSSTTASITEASDVTASTSASNASDLTTTAASGSSTVSVLKSDTTATSSASSATPSVIDFAGEKFAVVHYMIGNTYTYRLADWITELVLIEEAGFDAVALNTGPDCWQKASADLAYKAAAVLRTKLKLFWSFDMSTFPQGGDEDAKKIASYINEYAWNPYTFKMHGRPFVSTFSGDQYASSFGRSVCGGWDYVRSLTWSNFYFVPAFFFPNNQTIAGVHDCVEGLFQWNSAWSLDESRVSTAADLDWAAQLGKGKTYMAGVSPTFFTHYPETGLNKNWVYRADNNYATRWQQVTKINAPMVQVITWNDFGESHYIGPRPSSVQLQPINTTWVDGHNHLPWARITKPYIETYKKGAPSKLGSDLIIWEYRTHPAKTTATADPIGRPDRADLLDDEIYVTAYLSAPAEVRVQVGNIEGHFQADAGLNHFAQSFVPGKVTVGLWRDGENVGGTLTGERDIVAEPELYDFNPVVEQFFHDPEWEACKA